MKQRFKLTKITECDRCSVQIVEQVPSRVDFDLSRRILCHPGPCDACENRCDACAKFLRKNQDAEVHERPHDCKCEGKTEGIVFNEH